MALLQSGITFLNNANIANDIPDVDGDAIDNGTDIGNDGDEHRGGEGAGSGAGYGVVGGAGGGGRHGGVSVGRATA